MKVAVNVSHPECGVWQEVLDYDNIRETRTCIYCGKELPLILAPELQPIYVMYGRKDE